jgi:hypothetical protein
MLAVSGMVTGLAGPSTPELPVPERDKVVRSQIRSQRLQFNLPPVPFFYPPGCTPLLSPSTICSRSLIHSLPTGTFVVCLLCYRASKMYVANSSPRPIAIY